MKSLCLFTVIAVVLLLPASSLTQSLYEVPQDVCATAYWYQTLPSPALAQIESYAKRMADISWKPLPR